MTRTNFIVSLAATMVASSAIGCGGNPSAANIALRKQNQQLGDELAATKLQRDADAATIRSMQENKSAGPMVSIDKLDTLVTTHQLRIGRLTSVKHLADAAFPSAAKPTTVPSDAYVLEVHAVPLDETGDSIKSAGAFIIGAFDLSKSTADSLGHWEFTVDETRRLWLTGAFTYEYALPCVLKALPSSGKLTVRVTFNDALTGRQITEQKQVDVPTDLAAK